MIRYLLFVTFFFFSINNAVAQQDKQDIQNTLTRYFELVGKNQFVESIDFLFPKMFEMMPKEKLAEAYRTMLADSTVQFSMSDLKINKISKIITLKEYKFALVKYQYKLTLKTTRDFPETGSDFFIESLKTRYNVKKVDMDKENKRIGIDVNTAMFVIRHASFDGWKVLEKKESNKLLFRTFLSEQDIEKLFALK